MANVAPRHMLRRHTQRLLVGCTATVMAVVGLSYAPSARGEESVPTVVALWHMEELEGTPTATDASGFGNDGVVSPDVVQGIDGYQGQGYEFTGPAPIVKVPNGKGSLNPGASPLLISARLKVPADLVPGDYNVIQKGTATAKGGAYKLEMFAPLALTNKKWGFPRCAVNSSATATDIKRKNHAYGPYRINDGQWHLVECRLTATSLTVIVDGDSGATVPRTVGPISNSVGLTLGGKPNNTHYFNGALDEASITIG
ncbi:MAG TPA: LamG-like jellyroll fold domain-containing protein [Nocardioidaceae bacterium]|nr:LamG-like jellyroll fold domain-containing protein [Nocardioidaceae bacterium]